MKHYNVYQAKDASIQDYDIYPMNDLLDPQKKDISYKLTELRFERKYSSHWLRGPKPNLDNEYFTVLGSAHSFGRYCKDPYPNILSDKLDMGCLNLSVGGAEPGIYLHDKLNSIFELVNKSKFVILQIMSGRSSDNSYIKSNGHYCKIKSSGEKVLTSDFYKKMINEGHMPTLKKIISETQENYVKSYVELINKIKVPIVLFWFSNRTPKLTLKYDSLFGLQFGVFPQLVNNNMVGKIKDYCDDYAECVSDKGKPHLLKNRFTGDFMWNDDKWSRPYEKYNGQQIDAYYPSPEMHIDATTQLLSVCKKYLK
jgi:hypothetical protein